jgi:uncharacterized protein DUF4190
MKRCPTCNQTFTDEWLTFCTQDGTSLVNVERSPNEPPPTIAYPAMPPSVSPSEQPTLDLPASYKPPLAQYNAPQPLQAGWTPPPPPPFSKPKQQQGLAITSLVLGIVSVTLGFCCYFGVLTSPVAIGLGIFALIQIKNDPAKYGGKPLAIGGIVAGGLYFLFLALIILIYGLSFLSSGIR